MSVVRIRRFVIRHWFAIRNWSLFAAGAAVLCYIAFAVDLFENEGGLTVKAATLELDEALLIGAAVAVALLAFGVRHYLLQQREIARRITAERQARELAYQDGLTGLPNRRQHDEALRAALGAPPRAGGAHAALFLDLNGFKQVNDVHGHAVGDALLIEVARRLQPAMRDGDMVARFGGDEFAILARHLNDPEAATNIALRVIETVDAPIEAGGAVNRIGVGIGIALLPSDAGTGEEALRKADVALYRATAERRSALRFFEAEMDARVLERAAMESALPRAIDGGHIRATYLPSFDLQSREVIGFEVAPRWVDAEQGEVDLQRFTAIAEEAGLIHVLAERILRQACLAARDWPDHVVLAVDIYPSQLRDRLLPARIARILAETGLAPNRLELEITESALVADMEHAQTVLGALRAVGMRIAVKNFGTGYSSLYHLRNIKIDKVKIDRSFIQAMTTERESASIVRALVGLGQGLGMIVAADGIASGEEEATLLSTGCEQGQGAYLGGSLSPSEAMALIGSARERRSA